MTLPLCAALLLAAVAPTQRRTGTVVYATQKRLYLDAGSRDGLAVGSVLKLRRAGKAAGTCTVETVDDAKATCAGSGLAGDVFDVSPPPPAPPAQVQRPPPPEPVQVVDQRKAAVTSVEYDKVDYHGGLEAGAAPRAEAVVAHATWAATGAGPWHQERADVLVRDARLGYGFTFDLDLSARHWTMRSDPISFRPEDKNQLYVWEAAVSRRALAGGFSFSAGRVRPQFVPGQIIFDGARAGWHTAGGSEVGFFGGAVPDEVTTAVSFDHGTFGGYWSGQHAGDSDSVLRLFRHELRVASVSSASLGKRVEGEALLQLFLTKMFDASADVRVGRGDHQAPNSLDAVRIDGNLTATDTLSFTGGFRYEGVSIRELDGPNNVQYGGNARHADLTAQWDAASMLRITVISGLATDLTLDQTRRWIGPEIGSPRLFGGNAGVAAGYLEEDGWAKGRSGYLQLNGRIASRVQSMLRLSWFHSISGLSPEATDELGAFLSLRAQLSRFVSLRLAAMGRSSLNGDRKVFGGATTQAGWFDAALAGQF